MSKQLENKLAEHDASIETLTGQMKRLLLCPKIMHLVETYEADERARQLVIAEDVKRAEERAKAEAAIVRSCQHPDGKWQGLRIPPEGPGCIAVEVDLGSLGKRRIAPGAIAKNMRAIELADLLKRDRILARAVADGVVLVEDLPLDRAVALERSARGQL